ncbi:hemagglutinin repeat-containing protein [Actinobacillus equuli subsp. equuli]|uniref:two-partner secretion domain-containing protein n=1 Tax=Actinobacillus equuli TaxID=718 RepID=UPI00244283BE|nr:hemagglutinin repeat-containing protein [Actinobacillus equuli]WGE55454.1 hemagglutinin repeat-containing protein [Actinobacillus equuli subsp. equuli]
MNKKSFRVIFSKTLQRLVVVSELAKSEGKGSEASASSTSGLISSIFCKIRPLTFSLFCALGFVCFSENALAELVIQADKSAPKYAQPIVLKTANGLPQVNIQTPNDKGLSHNKYSKFDVDTKGAILNNSRTQTQTQQAGMIQGNPYLARGEAKVILNEVNSNDPSVLKGYVEVAGKKADVIIANPSGLHCEGCGIINSDRATLTTGKPQIKQGNLDSFVVERGKVKVSGKGLDNSRVDYTEILARETEVNAGIWSKKETKVVTGKNTIKRSNHAEDLQIIHTKQPLVGENQPRFAVDVGELGGMYSGKIHLIGTEKGVGVRNAGHIGASVETLKIDSQGRIVNSGTLNAKKDVQLVGTKGIENRGKIENRQGNITLNTPADIHQDGIIVARAGHIHKTANQSITQHGETVAKGNIRYQATKVTASKDSLIAAGVEVKDTAQGETRVIEKASAEGKTIAVQTSEKATLQGKHLASGRINVKTSEANLDNSYTSAYSIYVDASKSHVQANSATLLAKNDLTLNTPVGLETKGSYLKAERITTKQRSLNTQDAMWEQTGLSELKLEVVDKLQNQGGTFKTQGDLSVKANGINNRQGRLLANGKLTVNAGKDEVDSTQGIMLSNQTFSITSGELINDAGLIQSNQNVSINTQGQALSNQQGRIISGGKQTLQTADINNRQGLVYTQQDFILNGSNLTNDKGKISTAKQADISLSGKLSQQNGVVEVQKLNLKVNALNSTAQSLILADTSNISTLDKLTNQDSRIITKQKGDIRTGNTLNNTNGTLSSQQGSLTIYTDNHSLINEKGIIIAYQNATIDSGVIDNKQGLIFANNVALNSNNQTISNQNTLSEKQDKGIIAQNSLVLTTDLLNNDKGNIFSRNKTVINTNLLLQNTGLITANIVNLVSQVIRSNQNSEISGQQVNVKSQILDNKGSKLIAHQMAHIDVKQGVQNYNGTLASLGKVLSINTHQSELNNAGGMIAVQNGTLKLETNKLDNQQGVIRAHTADITAVQSVDNRNTLADIVQGIVVTDLMLKTKQLDNQAGRITSFNQAMLQSTDIRNQAGEILAVKDGQLNTDKIYNQSGTIASTKANLSIHTQAALNNRQGYISAADKLTLDIKGLENKLGNIASSNQLVINTAKQKLDNQSGSIFANNQAEIDSGEINNQKGLIRAENLLSINANQNEIDNRNTQSTAQGIVGLGNVILHHVDSLLNQQGKFYAENSLEATIKQNVDNSQGVIQSNGDLIVTTTAIDNQAGKLTAKHVGNVTAQSINNNAVSEKGSLIYADSLTLNVQQLNNQDTKAKGEQPKQGIQGRDITLQTQSLNNRQGGIYSLNNLSIVTNERIDTQQGELLAVDTVKVQHHGHLMLNNENGLIQGNKAVDINAKGLESEGNIKTKGNLNISLKDSFTLNNAFEAENLMFKTEGDFTNNIEQTIANKMTVSANNIVNNAKAELSANETTLNSNHLTNRGLIDGNKTLVNSTKVTNIGTGRIYGNHLTFNSNTVENLAETINGETKSGTIAARNRLDFGVGKLVNRDHALILSLDKLFIGGKLDSNSKAIGKASFIDNGSATIEVLGDSRISSTRLLNHDLYVKTGIDTKVEKINEHALGKSAHRYREKRDGYYRVNNGSRNPNSYFQLNNGTRIEGKGWYSWNYKQTTSTTTLEHTDSSKISIGGTLVLDGNDLHNKYSQLLVGNQLWLGNTVFNENTQNSSLNGSNVKLHNEDIKGEINRQDEGTYRIEYRVRKKKGRKGHYHYHHNGLKYGPYAHPTEYFSFNRVLNTIGMPISSNASVEEKTPSKDIKLETVSVVSPQIENVDKLVSSPQLKTLNKTEITFKSAIDNNTIIDSGQIMATPNTSVEQFRTKNIPNITLPVVKTHLNKVSLPQASLYKINPEAPKGYLVETDPKFTNQKQWLSSDYMLEQLRDKQDNIYKRLGDGFYEQRLINEQINQLTGRRYIGSYHNDLAQYQALMNSGVKYAKQFNLAVGVGLTAKQMSELTTDMVWLVNKEVTLADGRKVTVLVPQVYLVARDSDITSRGAVISANQIIGSVANLQNRGVIAGRDLTRIHSNQFENRGTILGNSVDLSATQNLINLGGKIEAVKSLSLSAGKSLEIASTLSSSQSAHNAFSHTILDQTGTVKVTGKHGQLNLYSDNNLTVKAAHIESEGSVSATAKNALQITTLNISNKEHYNHDADNYYRLDQKSEVGSIFSSKEGVSLRGQKGVTLRQAIVSSDGSDIFIGSKGDVRLEVGEQSEQLASSSKGSTKGWFSKTTETRRHHHDTTEAVGSEIDGKSVTLYSQAGKVYVHGSTVVADKKLDINSKTGVNITSATNTYYVEDEHIKTKSGLMGVKGGLGFTLGKKKEQLETDNFQERAVSSRVGSLSGNTMIHTDGHYQQKGSVVTSGKGNVDISAQSAEITAARSDYKSNYKYTLEQKGVTATLTGAIASAIQAVDSTLKSAKALGSSKNDRINALGAVNAGFEAMRTAEQVQGIVKAASEGSATGGAVGVSVTYGQQKSEQTQHSKGNTAEKSQVNAGGKVNILTTGKGEQSDITIAGSDVSGQAGTHLKADGKVNIEAIDENHLERSKNKLSGFSAGVGIQFGDGITAGVAAGGNVAKGYGNGESQAWVASQVGSQDSKTTIESGRDANIIGSQVQGKRVEVTADNLNIESLQDTAKYKGKQERISGQVTVGYGVSVGGSYGKSKINSDYASVKTQAGISAGDEGYDVNINNKVKLTGSAILSSAEKEKNSLSARTFSFTDIINHSDATASSSGFGMGFSVGKDQTSKEDKQNNKVYRAEREKNGETFDKANPNKGSSNSIKFGLGESDVHSADFYALAKIGTVNLLSNTKKSINSSSVTPSVISDGVFTIRDREGQENISHIKKGTTEQTNRLEQQDYRSLQKDVETDTATKKAFYSNMAGLTDEAYRTMFIAEHRMLTAEIDENGKPILDTNLLNEIDKESDKKGINREEYRKDQEVKGRNIYRLRELSDQDRNNLKQVTYTDPLTRKSETKYVVAFNGIFNDENAAAKFAWQNYVAKESQSGKIDSRVHQNVYFVHHPQAGNTISELLVAGYEKMFETSFGNVLGMDNSSLQAKELMTKYGKNELFVGSHSRGTLTVTNALNSLNTKENRDDKLLSGTTVKMVGPATNVTHADNVLSVLQTGKERTNREGSIRIENHEQDPVGSMPIILGGNPATMNDNEQNRGVIRRVIDMFGDNSSMHNCYGLGQKQCVTDGYRKNEKDLIMNKEQTIYDLNRNSNK